jgi:hypothetical protein
MRSFTRVGNPPAVNLSGANEVDKACADLARLPRLRQVYLAGQPVEDRHLHHFRGLQQLHTLRLGDCPVSIAAAEELADAMGGIDVDAACGERLYHATLAEVSCGLTDAMHCVQTFETAAAWKRACAAFKGEGAKAAAWEQLAEWLDRVVDYMRTQKMNKGVRRWPAQHLALLECASSQARAQAALAAGDKSAAVLAAENGLRHAAQLLPAGWRESLVSGDTPENPNWCGWWAPHYIARALERGAATKVLHAELTGDREAELDALRRYETDLAALESHLSRLREQQLPGGELSYYCPVKIRLIEVRVRLAELAGKKAEAIRLLEQSADDISLLRDAAEAAHEAGCQTDEYLALCWRKATDLEIALARLTGDPQSELEAERRWCRFVTYRCVKRLTWHGLACGGGGEILGDYAFHRCLYATAQLRQLGRKFYEGSVAALQPDAKQWKTILAARGELGEQEATGPEPPPPEPEEVGLPESDADAESLRP